MRRPCGHALSTGVRCGRPRLSRYVPIRKQKGRVLVIVGWEDRQDVFRSSLAERVRFVETPRRHVQV